MAFRSSFARAALLVINLFVWLGGLAILAIGAWIVSDLAATNTEAVGESAMWSIGVAAIALGSVVTIIGISGCCGAWKESVCCLKMYAILLSVIVLLELTLGIMSIVLPGKMESELEKGLLKMVAAYNFDKTATAKMDYLQQTLHCCGCTGPDDYAQSTNISTSIYDVPASCCIPEKVCVLEFESDSIYQTGCSEKALEYAEEYLAAMIAVAFTVVICQGLSLAFAFCLIRSIQDKDKV
ncbi:23 kDa integral membrane protein-like [Anneissia japonica]|uniref:23 kDa integral membrane protein-like n=1 Tax=Anneissia japonica TaxID=1529436 RepID=UPI001425B5D3|nr:23 kDa integral membrane protein-like [Anneissia japonica]